MPDIARSAAVPVVTGIYGALNVSAVTTLARNGVHTDVPPGTKPPYVLVRYVTQVPWSTYAKKGKQVFVAVDIYAQARGPALAGAISDAVLALLDVHPPTIVAPGFAVVSQQHEDGENTGDELSDVGGVKTQHLVEMFRVRVMQV